MARQLPRYESPTQAIREQFTIGLLSVLRSPNCSQLRLSGTLRGRYTAPGVILSLDRMASIPSLIPGNDPSMATPSLGFHMNRTLDSCLPTIRFLKLIVMFPR